VFPTGVSTKLGVCRGWAYALIKQISFRYGGSSQYFLSGQQVLETALSMASDSGSRDAILSLGGDALTNDGTTDGFATAKSGYVWLPLPHCVPSAEGKLPPLPSDLLTQQIQVTVELYPLSKIFSIASGGSTTNVPLGLSAAKFQVQQVLLENQGDALARRVDMTTNVLSYPVQFRQQEVTIQLNGGASITPSGVTDPFQVTLTGFRSGEVREVHAWLTADSANTPTPAATMAQAPFAWYALQDAVMTYAGEIYARFDANSGQLWNLVNGRIPAQVADVLPIASGTTVTFSPPTADAWTVLPFGQTYDAPTAHSMYMAGKPITNGIVNLSFNIPKSAPTSTYTLHLSYVYNAVLTFSQGTCDYVF
jgi:hypothetical protein